MTRKLASIQKIVAVTPIKDADKIEKVQVLGWECVVQKKENFKVGDLVVYIEVDSIVPPKPEFEFLKDRKYRVRTIKLRGQISQGLVLPLSYLPKKTFAKHSDNTERLSWKEGDDVTDLLGIKKYDPEGDKEQALLAERELREKNKIKKFFMRYNWFRRIFLKKRDKFPSFIKKTDEDRIQLFPNICQDFNGRFFNVTEKIDGQSATYFLIRGKGLFKRNTFGVCSRNLHLPKPDNSSYWTIAKQNHIKDILEKMMKDFGSTVIVLQGEIIGPGIQGNKYGRSNYEFYAFNLILNGTRICNSVLDYNGHKYGFNVVPILDYHYFLPTTIQEAVEHSKGLSKLAPIQREGVVMRLHENNDFSFKVINPDFLLEHEE